MDRLRAIRLGGWLALAAVWLVASAPALAEEYLVREGDSLARIARVRLGDEKRWLEIARLNNIPAPFKIKAGQRIQLPPGARPAGPPAPTAGPANPSGARPGPVAGPRAGPRPTTAATSQASVRDKQRYWGIALLIVGTIIGVTGFVMFLIGAGRVNPWWAVGSFFCCLVWPFFAIRHWEKPGWKGGALLFLAGSALGSMGEVLLKFA